jgi:demethylmenaquinone methyltransferase / 2-methoxy-6-polyprenyl-1,4-benzoquinol methylase
MSKTTHTVPTFQQLGAPFLYDLLVRFIYFPVGGERALREAAVARLSLGSGSRVLELGCGTGSFTRLLLGTGASVTSVDGSARMLERARSKAAGATFECQDLRAFHASEGERFELVFFGFVLHELPKSVRAALLSEAARVLSPEGHVAIVEHAVPSGRGFAWAWRRFLLALEPATVRDVIEGGYEEEVAAAGLEVVERAALAAGTGKMLVLRRVAA